MTTRMRIVGWNVQPVVMADDDVTLTHVPVQSAFVHAPDWDAFKAGGDAQALEQVRAQVEGPPPEPPVT